MEGKEMNLFTDILDGLQLQAQQKQEHEHEYGDVPFLVALLRIILGILIL